MSGLGAMIAEKEGKKRDAENIIRFVETYSRKLNVDIEDACEVLDVGLEEYNKAKELIKSLSE